MGKPEAEIEDYLRKSCKSNQMMCLKFTSPGVRGVPDRIVISSGDVVFVELKSPVGKTSKIQNIIIPRMRMYGADVRVINSKEKVDNLITELIKRREKTPTHIPKN